MVNTTYAQSQGIIYYLLSFNPLKSKKKDLLLCIHYHTYDMHTMIF